MKRSRILFAALIISTIFYSCDSDNPAGPKADSGDSGDNNNNQGELSITLSINRNRIWLSTDEKTGTVYADIKRNGQPVTDAKVLVNGKELSFEGVSLKQYKANISYSLLTPNQKIKCSITIDGKTAEEEVVLPGNIGISGGGSLVTWNHEGNSDYVYVQEVGSDTTYMSLNNSNDVNSMFTVPNEAYPKTGTQYVLNVIVRNTVNNAFSSLSPESAIITASDLFSILVTTSKE